MRKIGKAYFSFSLITAFLIENFRIWDYLHEFLLSFKHYQFSEYANSAFYPVFSFTFFAEISSVATLVFLIAKRARIGASTWLTVCGCAAFSLSLLAFHHFYAVDAVNFSEDVIDSYFSQISRLPEKTASEVAKRAGMRRTTDFDVFFKDLSNCRICEIDPSVPLDEAAIRKEISVAKPNSPISLIRNKVRLVELVKTDNGNGFELLYSLRKESNETFYLLAASCSIFFPIFFAWFVFPFLLPALHSAILGERFDNRRD